MKKKSPRLGKKVKGTAKGGVGHAAWTRNRGGRGGQRAGHKVLKRSAEPVASCTSREDGKERGIRKY